MPLFKKQAHTQKKKDTFGGHYFEFVTGEKSTKFVDIVNRAKA